MVNIRHILRLHNQKQTISEIVIQTGIARLTLRRHLKDFRESGLTFEEINELSDKDLNELFTIPEESALKERQEALFKLFPDMDRELRKKGVTQLLLWEEYKKSHPDGVGKSQFLWYFSKWKSRIMPTMRIDHKAGDRMYIDFTGQKLMVTDKETGKEKPVEVFVAVLGASQLTFVQAVRSQRKEDFVSACEDALHYFGGVPAAIVCDNLKSAVTKSCKYEPTINETFADFAEHYNTTILPARAYRPTDKAIVEVMVNVMYKRIHAMIREKKFYSLEELNNTISILLEEHNNRLRSGRNYSRRQQFNELEKNTLVALPMLRYEFKSQFHATVMKNGYISFGIDKHYYSVPYLYIGKKVKILFSRYNVEIFYNYERIALHKREHSPYKYTTDKEHLHHAHRSMSEMGPNRFLKQAGEIHPDVKLYISKILENRKYPEQAYRICIGVLSFSRKVGDERLIKACKRALDYKIYNYRTIKTILEKGLDGQDDEFEQLKMPEHNNIRGKDYYK